MSYGTSSDPNLRRRNDYFAPPEGSFTTDVPVSTYPPYSELPFTSLKRRKQGTNFVKWTMRAVLASPMVVLVIWSIVAVLFSNKHAGNSLKSSSSNHNKQRRTKGNNPNNSMMFYDNMMYNPYMQGQSQQFDMNMANQQQPQQQVYGSAPRQLQQQQGQQVVMMQNPQQQQQQQQAMMNSQPQQESQTNMMANPQAMLAASSGSQSLMVVQPPPPQQRQLSPPQQQNQPVMTPEQFLASRGTSRQGNMLPVISPLGSTAAAAGGGGGQEVVQQMATNTQMMDTQPRGNSATSAQQQGTQAIIGQQPQQLGEEAPPMGQVRIEPLQAGSPGDLNITQANPMGQESVVYYYYPSHAIDSNGNVRVPTVIFDRKGNPVDLKALQGKQVYMEPPKARTLAVGSIPKWGDSSSQDQSIIVATVAVMALLVGALSARRMRARSFLSACIENESLEDDVAYDTAYTTTESNSYNTFGGWKGDLEKFDV